MSLLTRLRNAFRPDALTDEIDREMAFHIDQRADDLVARGMSPRTARAEARRRFGNIGKHADEARDRDLLAWFATLLADVRYALRTMRAHPGPTVIVGLTLAFGLGVNATVLGIVDGMVLRPYQFRDYQRLVVLWDTPAGAAARDAVSPANFLDWRQQSTRVEQLVAWEGWDATLTGGAEPERVLGFRVTNGFFALLGVAPAIGLSLAGEEERPGNDRSVIISDAFWKRRFGADALVVGRQLLLDDVGYTIVGVAPPSLDFPMAADFWAPLALSPARAADRKDRSLTVMGKLADGASLEDAQAEMDVVARRLATQHPDANRGRAVSVRTLSAAFTEGAAFIVGGVLQTAAGLVLLIACANLAGLLLARSIDRRRELAVRIALGASRGRVIRQLATETVVLSLIASAVALLFAKAGLGALRASVPVDTARYIEGWNNVRLDWEVMVAIPLLSVGIGLLVALLPALTALRGTTPEALKESDRGTVTSVPTLRGRQVLVVAEIALALAILIAAGITVKSGLRMVNRFGGFNASGLVITQLPIAPHRYGDAAARARFVDQLTERLARIPGAERVTAANILPANGWSPDAPVLVEDASLGADASARDLTGDATRWPRAGYRSVSDEFFETLRVRIVSGRRFVAADREGSQSVAIVSASFAARYWPNGSVLGKRLRVADTAHAWLTVVGVADDVDMYNWWDGIDYDAVYVPLRQAPPSGHVQIAIRARGDPDAVLSAVRPAVREVDATLPLDRVRTMSQAIREMGRGLNLLATFLAICGGIALLLAVIGIYGLMAYTFAQRTHEFGVRLAFGATARDVLRLTLRRAATLTAVGLGFGVPLAWAVGRGIASAMDGIVALDAPTFILVAVVLAAVSLGSAYVPARRALRLNPAAILRQ